MSQRDEPGRSQSEGGIPGEHPRRGVPYQQTYHHGPATLAPPGEFPFVRGVYASMYTERPWTVRQYAGFASAAESNAFYHACLAGGQRGLSVAFDLPTHRGYDSDHQAVAADVGMAGVAIDSVEDMARLFQGIALSDVSVSMTMNGAVLPILAAYVVTAEEQGFAPSSLQGTLQNDILKEFLVRNTYIYPPAPSLRIVGDIIAYCSRFLPRFNPISISGYHVQEAGANPPLELGITLANGLAYIETALAAGLSIDQFAPRLSFFFGVGMDFLLEVAKLRAARKLWATLVRERYNPQDPNSLRLRMHCQTSGVSLTAQEPLNNIVRTTVEAMAAVLGGTQSLHTNAFDEAWALPSDAAARVARQTQLILQGETDLCATVDPLAGSYAIEALTQQLVDQGRAFIEQVDQQGGMVRALEQGWVRRRIEQCSAIRQARIDRGVDPIVGVNVHTRTGADAVPNVRVVDNAKVLAEQIASLDVVRRTRDETRLSEKLEAVELCARNDNARAGELMVACVEAMRARATVGELTSALERVWGRHEGASGAVTGIYARELGSDAEWTSLVQRVSQLSNLTGRRPRLLVAKLGQDGHDRGAKVIASGFADAGFDVDLGPLFQTPQQVARVAIDNDVHVVGVSTHAGGHRTLVPELVERLRAEGANDILVVCGGIIPDVDREQLEQSGVGLIFAPGTSVLVCIEQVLSCLEHRNH
jgi:methylmalonyl-CoA mutase